MVRFEIIEGSKFELLTEEELASVAGGACTCKKGTLVVHY